MTLCELDNSTFVLFFYIKHDVYLLDQFLQCIWITCAITTPVHHRNLPKQEVMCPKVQYALKLSEKMTDSNSAAIWLAIWGVSHLSLIGPISFLSPTHIWKSWKKTQIKDIDIFLVLSLSVAYLFQSLDLISSTAYSRRKSTEILIA